MSKLRKIVKKVNRYVFLVSKRPDIIKKNLDFYYNDFSRLKEKITDYSNQQLSLFRYWCGVNANSFDCNTNNVVSNIKKYIITTKANFYMNRLSYNLSILDILCNNIDFVSTRLEQFKAFQNLH